MKKQRMFVKIEWRATGVFNRNPDRLIEVFRNELYSDISKKDVKKDLKENTSDFTAGMLRALLKGTFKKVSITMKDESIVTYWVEDKIA